MILKQNTIFIHNQFLLFQIHVSFLHKVRVNATICRLQHMKTFTSLKEKGIIWTQCIPDNKSFVSYNNHIYIVIKVEIMKMSHQLNIEYYFFNIELYYPLNIIFLHWCYTKIAIPWKHRPRWNCQHFLDHYLASLPPPHVGYVWRIHTVSSDIKVRLNEYFKCNWTKRINVTCNKFSLFYGLCSK